MARGFISVTNTGLTEIADYLDQLGDEYEAAIFESVQAMEEVVVERIKVNWVSMVGGEVGGYVHQSIGKSTAKSKNDKNVVVGTMGVYNLDSVNATFGKTDKNLNAAQIAYWIENGTSRLASGGRKVKGVEYSDEELITMTAKPFIGNAFYGSINEQNDAFRVTFNKKMDNVK